MKISTGIEKLDEVLDGGVKSNSSVLLLADNLVDKSSFVQHILSARILDNDKGIYVTTSKTPTNIVKNMYEYGWEYKGLVFVDCISNTLEEKTKSKYALKTKITKVPEAFEETLKLFKQALKDKEGPKIVIFDSLETFMGVGAEKIAKEIEELKQVFDDTRSTCIFLLTDWGYGKGELRKICDVVDTVVNLGTIEKKLIWMNYFQFDNFSRIFFQIAQTGVGLYVPKILITGPFHSGKSSTVHALSEKAVSVDRLGTTVALDHGYIEKKGMVCDIFGTPGQERFDWILKILSRDIWGIILVVDSTRPETFDRAKEMLAQIKGYEIPFVIFANKQDLRNAIKPRDIEKKLGLPVLGTSATKNEGLEEGLKLLFDKIYLK